MPIADPMTDRLELEALLWTAVHQPPAVRQRLLAGIADLALAAAVAQRLVEGQVEAVQRRGWSPSEVLHVAARRSDEPHVVGILAAALVAVHATRSLAGRQWTPEVDAIAEAGTARHTSARTLPAALDAIALLLRLPQLPATPEPARPADHRTATLLDRVRALLRKAESTTFEAEADALTAKAQQLITRHALDDVLLRTDGPAAGGPVLRRVLLDDPYLAAKALLVHVVASANRCTSTFSPDSAWCSVVGHPGDLAATQVLVASLLTQAVAAMARTGTRRDARGRVRTRSFRRTFLEAYAVRIGDRLASAAAAEVEAHADADRLLPALASRELAVREATDRLIGPTRRVRHRPPDPQGWAAGTAAADLADLDATAGRITS
jgi:hypothetical protein